MKKINQKMPNEMKVKWEQIMRSTIESSINAIAVADPEGNLFYVNNSFLKIWGYDNDKEVLGRPVVGFWQMRGKALKVIEALRAGGSWIGELVAKRKDGSTFDVHLSMNMVTDKAGKPICLIGSFIDIIERKKAEEALRESEERYRDLVEQMSEGLGVVNADGILTYVNTRIANILEYSPEEMVGKHAFAFVDEEYMELLKKEAEKRRKGIGGKFELVFTSKTGKKIPVMVSSKPIFKNRKHVGSYTTIIDMTERKKAEEALKESEERYRHIFEQCPIGIGISSLDGKVVAANEAMEAITGYSLEELKKINLADTYENTEDRKALRKAISRYGSVVDFPVRLKRKDGTPYDALLSVSRINLAGKDFFHTMCQDITERKKAEAELMQAQRLASIGQLAAGVAHEINNPLSVLYGEIQWLLEKSKDKKFVKSLALMKKVSKKIADIVNNLLTFSREASIKVKKLSNINSLIERTLSLIERRFELNNVKVVKKFDKILPDLIVDRGQIEQVFMNILLNSLDAMPDGGKLTISTRLSSAKDAVEITFVDTGRGIPKEDLPKLFDPFFTTRPTGRGTGLGLSITHGIVENHGGSIKIDSELNKGTKVLIRLPVK